MLKGLTKAFVVLGRVCSGLILGNIPSKYKLILCHGKVMLQYCSPNINKWNKMVDKK